MPDGQVLEFDRVTKRFSDVAAVTDFSGRVEPGLVTGFLGPNGAGKTTTLRMLLGQIRPTSGTATIGGSAYSDLKHPARVIGAMHEDPGFRPRRTVERHLILAAKTNGIAPARVAEVIAFVGLDGEAETRIGALSLGMRQRLSAATALLGDPGALVLDEPANGLDPEGIRWMRMLIRGLADEGRTVLISSHVLSEVEQVADEILVIAHGQRKFAGSLASLADPTSGPVVVDAIDRASLTGALTAAGFEFEVLRSGLTVRGSDAKTIGSVAAAAGVALTTLQQRGPTLEDVFLDLVNDRPVQLRKPEPVDATVALPVAPDAGPADAAADRAESTDAAAVTDAPPADADATPEPEVMETEAPAEAPAEPEVVDAEAGESSASGDADAEAPIEAEPVGTADGDEDDVAADEIDPESFVPVSAAVPSTDESGTREDAPETADVEDRPLPGVTGLAAAAAGLAGGDSTDTSPAPVISDAWAALITGRPVSADEDASEQEASESAHTEPEAEYTEYAHEQHLADGAQPDGQVADQDAEASEIISSVPNGDDSSGAEPSERSDS